MEQNIGEQIAKAAQEANPEDVAVLEETPKLDITSEYAKLSGHPNFSAEQIRKIMELFYRSLPNHGKQQRKKVINTSFTKRKRKRLIAKNSRRKNRNKK